MKEKLNLVLLLGFLFALVLLVSIFVYREFAPQDNTAATIYYISPDGNDNTGNGSSNSPWRTITKANSTISAGDTVILKDGNYPAYVGLTKPNTTWKAENKHRAILDGGFRPSSINNNWSNIVQVWDNSCQGQHEYSPLLSIANVSNITVDGLFLRNSCGTGIIITAGGEGNRDGLAENNTIKNSRVDWTLNKGIDTDGNRTNSDYPNRVLNTKIYDNIFTRISIGDEYYIRAGCANGNSYCVNVSTFLGGKDTHVKGNIFAWGRGELSTGGNNRGLIFEENIVVGMKNAFYVGWDQNVTFRNNLLYAPEDPPRGAGDPDSEDSTSKWRMVLRNENNGGKYGSQTNKKISFYNNLIINTAFSIERTHNGVTRDNEEIYVGNNTFVTGSSQNRIIVVTGGSTATHPDPILTGIFENNIVDIRKSDRTADVLIQSSLSGNDHFTYRNNLWPTNPPNGVKGPGDVYSNDPGLENATTELILTEPSTPSAEMDIDKLLAVVNINNYRLKQNSPAINAGTTASGTNSTDIPGLVRSQDYFKNSRSGAPDLGAIEYGGVFHSSTPTPIQSSTPVPTHINTPVPVHTNTPVPPGNTNTPRPTATTPPISGNACGKSDADGDGRLEIEDFQAFGQAYGMGTNRCADKNIDYGPCGGRDVNRDGILDIVDFGGENIGFSQRYYPKTSCAL